MIFTWYRYANIWQVGCQNIPLYVICKIPIRTGSNITNWIDYRVIEIGVLTATSGTFLLTVNTLKYFNERIIVHEKAEDTEIWTLLKAGALEQKKYNTIDAVPSL
jgi:hypothetical protein